MKRFGVAALMAVLVLGLSVYLAACSGGGGGGGSDSGTPLATYSTTTQAAAATSTTMGVMTTMGAQISSGMSMGLSSIPAGYAAKFAKRNSGGDIGSIDPTLKMMMENMAKRSKSPVIQKAVKKAAALKAKRVISVNDPLPCDNAGGTIMIVGTNNSDDASAPADISTYDITFNSCRDNITSTETNGTLHIEDNSSRNAPYAYSSSLTANLTEKIYTDSTFTALSQQFVFSGTFSDNDQITSGTVGANGSFVMTIPAQGAAPATQITLAFTNLSDTWTSTRNADGTDTDVDTVGGAFGITVSSDSTVNFQLTLSLNLVDKWQFMNDSAGTEKNWMNGSISVSWVPDLSASGCLPGSISISTVEADPLTYTFASGSICPISGTLTINNATVEFGTSSGTATDIIVTVNGTSQAYPSCFALDAAGGACMY
jgi:hypothetical protein